MNDDETLGRAVEALLLASEHPLSATELHTLFEGASADGLWSTPTTVQQIDAVLRRLSTTLTPFGGLECVQVGGGYRLRTPPDLAPIVRRLWPERAARLGGASLEVLAIVAYRQPCTRAEIEEVRGVDSGGVMRTLLERRLVKIVGRKDEPGRPLLYATTPEFLEVFGLESLRAMPTLRDLESLRAEEEARRAGDRQLELDALDALAETLSEAPQSDEAQSDEAQSDEADYTPSSSSPSDDDGV